MRDVGNEPVQKSHSEEDKVLKEDDETKPDCQHKEILAAKIVRLDRLKVLLIPRSELKEISNEKLFGLRSKAKETLLR